MSADDLLTVADVAALLRRSVKGLYRLFAPAGDLPCIRTQTGPGVVKRTRGQILVRRSDLDAWLDAHRTGPTPVPTTHPPRRLDLPGADRYVS